MLKKTKQGKTQAKKKSPAKSKAIKKPAKQDIKYSGPYPDLIKFLLFLKENHAREMAMESLKNAKEMDLPLMKFFAHVPEDVLVAQSLKSFEDNINSLIDGSYIEKQKASLKLWEEDKLPGISRDNIKPSDLVLVYASQKKTYLTFLPLYTKDMKEVIAIIKESDELNLKSQEAAINLMFRLSKEAEEKAVKTANLLRESEEKFQKAFQSSGAGITITRLSDSTYIDVNDAFVNMTGFSREELIGKSSVSAGLITDKEEREKILQHIRRFDAARNIEITTKNKSGKVIHVITSIETIILGGEKYALNIMYDISERKKAEEQLKKINVELKKSEDRLRRFTQGVKDYAIYMLDMNGNVVSWNDGAEKIKGYKDSEIIGKHISVFYTKEELEKNEPRHNLEMATKLGRFEKEGWRVRKDGSVFWADIAISPIYDSNGKLEGFTKITRDLTERKKIEDELLKANTRLSEYTDFLDSVLENIPNMVFVKDANELRFIRFNKAGEKLLGLSRNELIGKNDYDFFPKEQADFFTGKDQDVLKGNDVVDIAEEPINTKNGSRWLHTRKIPVKDVFDKPLYLVGISEDITEKRETMVQISNLNGELANNIRQLETVNKELEAFSYSVSHDLRSPLRAIHGYSKILLDEYISVLGEDGSNMLNAVMNNTIKMGQLIDDLLAFSRMGKKEMNVMEVDMGELAKVALHEVTSVYPNIDRVKITIKPLLPAKADYALMEQVFANLISNAVKYTGKVANPEVEISSYEKNGEKVYCVKDNGVGFDMKYYNKLFGVFQRLHSNAEFEGTGVGLALVKRILTRHNGRVWAEAEPNKGAAFYIALSN